MPTNPALTVVLIADNYRECAQRMLGSVLAQDIADQIVILVYDRAGFALGMANGLLFG